MLDQTGRDPTRPDRTGPDGEVGCKGRGDWIAVVWATLENVSPRIATLLTGAVETAQEEGRRSWVLYCAIDRSREGGRERASERARTSDEVMVLWGTGRHINGAAWCGVWRQLHWQMKKGPVQMSERKKGKDLSGSRSRNGGGEAADYCQDWLMMLQLIIIIIIIINSLLLLVIAFFSLSLDS
jgi:hypothetical protein